jgi:hypothetical protein
MEEGNSSIAAMRSGSEKIRLYCVVFVEERKQLVV